MATMHQVTEVNIKSTDSESELEGSQLEGDIIIPGFSNEETTTGEYNTLDEPILSTIVRISTETEAKCYNGCSERKLKVS